MIAQPVASTRGAGGGNARATPSASLLPDLTGPPATTAPFDESAGRVPWKVVYTIIERGKGRRVWLRVGVAFVNPD